MCQPAVSCPTPVQPEPESGENTGALEDILPGSCAKEVDTIRPQWLPTSGPHILRDEGAGETGLGQPEAAGESPARPSAICLPATWELMTLSSTCCNEPIRAWMVEETLWESHAFNTIQPLLLEEKRRNDLLDYRLPDRQATVCPYGQCSVWYGC